MITTKTMNSFVIGLVQISSYTALGSLKGSLWVFGLILGIGVSVGDQTVPLAIAVIGGLLFSMFSIHFFQLHRDRYAIHYIDGPSPILLVKRWNLAYKLNN